MPTRPTWSGSIQISLVPSRSRFFQRPILASRFNFTKLIARRISAYIIKMSTKQGTLKRRTS